MRCTACSLLCADEKCVTQTDPGQEVSSLKLHFWFLKRCLNSFLSAAAVFCITYVHTDMRPQGAFRAQDCQYISITRTDLPCLAWCIFEERHPYMPYGAKVRPLRIEDRAVVRPEVVSELGSRSTNHLNFNEINDNECRALVMVRDHSTLISARNSRKRTTRSSTIQGRQSYLIDRLTLQTTKASTATEQKASGERSLIFFSMTPTIQPTTWTWIRLPCLAVRSDPTDEVQGLSQG